MLDLVVKNLDNRSVKRGPYNKSFVLIDGERIVGLKRRPNRGRFYSAQFPNVTFGIDPIAAVIRFAQWQYRMRWSSLNPAVEIGKVNSAEMPTWESAKHLTPEQEERQRAWDRA